MSAKRKRVVEWQGRIVCRVTSDCFLVALYSWIDDHLTYHRVVNVREMWDWQFYANAYRMDEWFSLHQGGTAPTEGPPQTEVVHDLVGMWFHSFVEGKSTT